MMESLEDDIDNLVGVDRVVTPCLDDERNSVLDDLDSDCRD